jgi:hypothetical protein
MAGALVAAVLVRRWLAELLDRIRWRLRVTLQPREGLPATVWLLERRARRWGTDRPLDMSFRRWLESLACDLSRDACERLATLHDQRLFAPAVEDSGDDLLACRQACAKLGPGVFRRAVRTGADE